MGDRPRSTTIDEGFADLDRGRDVCGWRPRHRRAESLRALEAQREKSGRTSGAGDEL